MKQTTQYLLLLLLVTVTPCRAEITPQGQGLLFGPDHAFHITAPPGWVLDNESGRNQGVHMLFYLEDESWRDSPVFAYGRSVSYDGFSVEDQVRRTVADFHAQGSPDYQAHQQARMTLPDGQEVEIYFFNGDQWDNYEAAAYFPGESSLNFLVYNARNHEVFEENLPAFYAMVHSYRNRYPTPQQRLDELGRQQLADENSDDTASEAGQAYEVRLSEALAEHYGYIVNGCMAFYNPAEATTEFEYFFTISASGRLNERYIYPHTGLTSCFFGMMELPDQFPPPPEGDFTVRVVFHLAP